MIMRFSCATFLALAGVAGTDAFLSLAFKQPRLAPLGPILDGGWNNDDFLAALSGNGSSGEPEEEETAEEDEGQGGSRFKDMQRKAQQQESTSSMSRSVENPFLTTPDATPDTTPDTTQPVVGLSMEEQAAMYREMTARAALPDAPQRIAKTNKAGRPEGRNRDADTISNSADLYFAQLKRDSTVRGVARLQGDDETADRVFEDEGIKELDSLLVENPYLKGPGDQEDDSYKNGLPSEMFTPYMAPPPPTPEEFSTPGVSYREMLKQKKMKRSGGQATAQPVPTQPQEPVQEAPPKPPVVETQPEPVVAQAVTQTPQAPVPVQPAAVAPPQPAAVVTPPVASSAPVSSVSSDESRQKIRTYMGLLMKHRGGPGFGAGRLKGPEIDRFENILEEVAAMLRAEAGQSAAQPPVAAAPPAASEPAPVQSPVQPAFSQQSSVQNVAQDSPADSGQIDSTIACIEGAVTMYKNSPPAMKESVLVVLRAALMSAVDTCNKVMGSNEVVNYAESPADMGEIDSTIACIEGATTMYKNSPPELKGSVLVVLRAALLSAVNTCNTVIGGALPAAAPATPSQTEVVTASAPPAVSESVPQTPAPVAGTDANSKALDGIYENMKAAVGDGGLGLRPDLTSSEAADLSDQLLNMRGILMKELDTGIPDPEPAAAAGSAPASGESTASKYQQMLAKAKADKAGKA